MSKIKILIASIVLVLSSTLFALNVGAVDVLEEQCKTNPDNVVCQNQDDDINLVIKNVVNTLLFVVGILSVIMLIYGGIRYTASAGNPTNVTAAKNTILYAVIGLVVAFASFAIVNWVMDSLGGNPGQETEEEPLSLNVKLDKGINR